MKSIEASHIDFPGYIIYSCGEVRSLKKKYYYKLLTKCKDTPGYFYVGMSNKQKKRCSIGVHRLVAAVFMGARPNNLVIDHVDGNKLNNRLENLRYITPQHNIIRSKKPVRKLKKTIKGVCYRKEEGKWCAYLTLNGVKVYNESFKTKKEAILARKKAEKIYHKGFD